MARTRTIVAAAVAALSLTAASAAASGGGADHLRFTFETIVQEELTNPCTGEPFTSVGDFRDSFTVTATPSGMDIGDDHELVTYTGVSPSGAKYVGTSVELLHQVAPLELTGPNEVTLGGNPTIHWVRTGEDGTQDDFYWHTNTILHLDVETQSYTLVVEHTSEECR